MRDKARSGGFESLSDADRTKMRDCFAAMRAQREGGAGAPQNAQPASGNGAPTANAQRGGFGGGGGRGGFGGQRRRGNTRPGIVFVPGAKGPEPRMVMLGVNDWDYTEVVNGLKEGDKVFMMTAARLQQQQKDMQDRMRQRNNTMGGMRQNTPAGGSPSGAAGRTGGGR